MHQPLYRLVSLKCDIYEYVIKCTPWRVSHVRQNMFTLPKQLFFSGKQLGSTLVGFIYDTCYILLVLSSFIVLCRDVGTFVSYCEFAYPIGTFRLSFSKIVRLDVVRAEICSTLIYIKNDWQFGYNGSRWVSRLVNIPYAPQNEELKSSV